MDELKSRPLSSITIINRDCSPICRAVSWLATVIVVPIFFLCTPWGQELTAIIRECLIMLGS